MVEVADDRERGRAWWKPEIVIVVITTSIREHGFEKDERSDDETEDE